MRAYASSSPPRRRATQAQQEPDAGRDQHGLARVVPHVQADLPREVPRLGAYTLVAPLGVLRHLAVGLASPLRPAADLAGSALGAPADLVRDLLVPVLNVLRDFLVAVLDVLRDFLVTILEIVAQLLELLTGGSDSAVQIARHFGTLRINRIGILSHGFASISRTDWEGMRSHRFYRRETVGEGLAEIVPRRKHPVPPPAAK